METEGSHLAWLRLFQGGPKKAMLLAWPYEAHDGRKTMRTFADALGKLREVGSLRVGSTASIKSNGLILDDGYKIGFVTMVGSVRADGSIPAVLLPTSTSFTARTNRGERFTYPMELLANATVEFDGRTRLANGRYVHAVELKPARWPPKFTATDNQVVRHAVAFLGKREKCYLPLDEKLFPGLRLLHYDRVRRLRIKPLEGVVRYIRGQMPHLSRSQIESALKRAGTRFPRWKRRSRVVKPQ